jgi:hypothetical protein
MTILFVVALWICANALLLASALCGAAEER